MSKRIFSLAHLTAVVLAPPDLIHVAARTGYQSVGLRLIAVTPDSPGYPLMDDPAALRATKAAIADTGVGVQDIEFVRVTPELDVAALEPFVAAGAELGARYVLTAPYDPDHRRLSDTLGAIDALSEGYGMRAVLEFFPWTNVPDLKTAAEVVQATGRDSVGILLDTLHYTRGPSAPEQFQGIAPNRFPFVHVCDAPAGTSWTREQLFHAGRVERLPPGEGGIDVQAILRHLPPGVPVGLEVPMTRMMAEKGCEAVARRVREAASHLLG